MLHVVLIEEMLVEVIHFHLSVATAKVHVIICAIGTLMTEA